MKFFGASPHRAIKEKNSSVLIALMMLGIVYLSAVSAYLFGLLLDDHILNYLDYNFTLSAVALGIFAIFFALGAISRAFYFFLLPFVVLTVPNAVNDLMPSFWAAPITDRGATSVPLMTHLDLYLLLGVTRYGRVMDEVKHDHLTLSSVIMMVVAFLIVAGIFGWLVFGFSGVANPILFFGNNFQIRYLLYIAIFMRWLSYVDSRNFFRGLYLAVVLLIFESVIYTFVYGAQELTSGNFGTNTYGVLLGVMVIVLATDVDLPKRNKIPLLGFIFLAIILTGTRSALIAVPCTPLIYGAVVRYGLLKPALLGAGSLLVFAYIFFNDVETLAAPAMLLIETDYAYLASQDLVGGELSSLLTRLSLWTSSLKIIAEFPLGIGFSNFNYIKSDFGYSTPVFIDPHNDIINAVVQNGVVGGALLLGLIFFGFFALDFKVEHPLLGRRVFPLLIFAFLTGLTNSNFNKHQFFFIFIFITLSAILKVSASSRYK